MPSPETPTLQEHQEIRRKYVALTWQLWREQYAVRFIIWHPLPEELLRIESYLYWRGEISQVHGVTDIVGQIVGPIRDAFNSILSWFWNNVIRPGIDTLLGVVRGVMEWWFNVVKGILNTITSTISGLWSWIQSAIATYIDIAQSVFSSIWAGIQAVGAGISAGISALGAELTKATGWIWQQMEGFFSAIGEVLKNIGVWIVNAIRTHVIDPILAFLTSVFEGIKALITGIWNFISGGVVAHSPVEWRGSYMRWLGIITGVSVLAVSGFVGATLADVIHPFKDTRIKEVADFALKFSGMYFLQSAFFTTYFDIACAIPVRQELNAIFTPEIPGSGDLIRFVVREVLPPEEFPVAMSLQGFSKYWSNAYWEAHWMLPPPERTRTAFLRKQIPEAEYRKFLVWYDFKPDPRPGISLSDVDIMLQTQYDYPGRIDTRWLLEWGIITPEQGVELIKAGGMDPTWAPRLAEAYLLNQVREELGKVRVVYERRLKTGFMSKTDFAAALNTLHYATHVINTLTRWADEELDLEERLEEADEYEKLAKERVITPEEYANALRELKMVEERITRRVNHIKRLLLIAEQKAAAKKKATP